MASFRSRLSPVVTRAMKRFSVPGVAIGMILEGEEHHLGYGVTSVDFPLPVDDATMFQIGSTTKTYTGTVAAMLIEEGKLDLETPVRTYLPKFKLPDDKAAGQVLVRHLVTHTGGFVGDYFDDQGRGEDALRRIVRTMAKRTPQLTPVGKVWSYNNSGFYVLGRIIEEITGQPYETVVNERILQPLGMDRTFWFAEDVITHKVAVGHNVLGDRVEIARPWGIPRTANPAGGLVSTTVDQMKYARFHLDRGKAADGTRLLPAKAVRAMQRPLAPAGNLADSVGITWLLEKIDGARIVKHGGSINGHMSAFLLIPDRGFAITILTNGSRGHELGNTVLDWVLPELLDVHKPAPVTKPLTPAAAAPLLGRYQASFGHLVITADGDGLVLGYDIDPKVLEAEPDIASMLPPPLEIAMTGKDTAVVVGKRNPGTRIEFLRNGDGKTVEWVRFGGRINKKVD
jgi:CubicO group peptidase (beta-lactamase class C family)